MHDQQTDIDFSIGEAQRIRLNEPDEKGIFVRDNWRITKNVSSADIKKTAGIWNPKYNTSLVIAEVFCFNNISFIELCALNETDRGARYSEELKLTMFKNGNEHPDWDSAVTLNRIPDDGSIVLCNKPANEYWGDSYTLVIEDFGPSTETTSFALIIGFQNLGYFLIDTVWSSDGNGGTIIVMMCFAHNFG